MNTSSSLMLLSDFLSALRVHECFQVHAPQPHRHLGRTIELRTDKVLLTTHFKALARLGTYDYKRKLFEVRLTVPKNERRAPDLYHVRRDEADKVLAVVAKAAGSKETTREKLTERKQKLRAKGVGLRISTEADRQEIEDCAIDTEGYITPETLAFARQRLGFRPDPTEDRRWAAF